MALCDCKNLWINRCKKQSREIIPENIAEMGQDDQPSIEQQVADKETAMHIHKILHNMNEPYKEVFHYGYSVNFLFRDCKALSKTESWARVTYHRAKK